MDEIREYPEWLIAHADHGDPKCPGLLLPEERGNETDIRCNECGFVLKTISAVAAALAAAAAAVYTVLTAKIMRATSDNTTATRDILAAAYRPYLSVDGMAFTEISYTTEEPRLAVRIRNAGSVPARWIRMELNIKCQSITRAVPTDEGFVCLFPGQQFDAKASFTDEELPHLHDEGLEVVTKVTYQGATKTEYASYVTYRSNGFPHGFSLLSGHFE